MEFLHYSLILSSVNNVEEAKKCQRQQIPLNQHEHRSYELTEAGTVCTEAIQVCTRFSVLMLYFLDLCFYGIPEYMNEHISGSYAYSGPFGLSYLTLI